MIRWFERNRNNVIRNSFLLPILLVVIMSISHVVSWYDLGNPISWAIYLSVAVEIFALASVSATTLNMNKASVYLLFAVVTSIQILGNVFFEYQYIRLDNPRFKDWIELIEPAFTGWDSTDHRRLLALIQGGTLPAMSLIALHFYIKFNNQNIEQSSEINKQKDIREIEVHDYEVVNTGDEEIETHAPDLDVDSLLDADVVPENDTALDADTYDELMQELNKDTANKHGFKPGYRGIDPRTGQLKK